MRNFIHVCAIAMLPIALIGEPIAPYPAIKDIEAILPKIMSDPSRNGGENWLLLLPFLRTIDEYEYGSRVQRLPLSSEQIEIQRFVLDTMLRAKYAEDDETDLGKHDVFGLGLCMSFITKFSVMTSTNDMMKVADYLGGAGALPELPWGDMVNMARKLDVLVSLGTNVPPANSGMAYAAKGAFERRVLKTRHFRTEYNRLIADFRERTLKGVFKRLRNRYGSERREEGMALWSEFVRRAHATKGEVDKVVACER